MTSVVRLTVDGPLAPWEAIGLTFTDGTAWVGGVGLHVTGADVPTRLASWTLWQCPQRVSSIDGLATEHADDLGDLGDLGELGPGDEAPRHALGATSFDHVVVMTSSIERTCGEIERVTGEPLKRIREAGPVRQGFHRLGPMIVEVVESDRVTSDEAAFWGFVWNVDDLFDVAERLGPDVLSPPKQAVQPGRYISSFRAEAGLGLPIALMTPHVR
jgi:hypothetical protein